MIIFIAAKVRKDPIQYTPEQVRYIWKVGYNFRALNGSNSYGKQGNDAVINKNNCDRTSTIYFVSGDFFVRLQDGIRG